MPDETPAPQRGWQVTLPPGGLPGRALPAELIPRDQWNRSFREQVAGMIRRRAEAAAPLRFIGVDPAAPGSRDGTAVAAAVVNPDGTITFTSELLRAGEDANNNFFPREVIERALAQADRDDALRAAVAAVAGVVPAGITGATNAATVSGMPSIDDLRAAAAELRRAHGDGRRLVQEYWQEFLNQPLPPLTSPPAYPERDRARDAFRAAALAESEFYDRSLGTPFVEVDVSSPPAPPPAAQDPQLAAETARVLRVATDYASLVALRQSQRVAAGDWVRAVPAQNTFEKVPAPCDGRPELDGRPGRVARYVSRVGAVWVTEAEETVELADFPSVGRITRPLPGAHDPYPLFPCVEPGCAAARGTESLFCREHGARPRPTAQALELARRRHLALAAARAAHPAPGPVATRLAAEAALTEQMVAAYSRQLARAATAAQTREQAAEAAAAQARLQEERERAELARLMAKYNVTPGAAGDAPAPGRRHLDI